MKWLKWCHLSLRDLCSCWKMTLWGYWWPTRPTYPKVSGFNELGMRQKKKINFFLVDEQQWYPPLELSQSKMLAVALCASGMFNMMVAQDYRSAGQHKKIRFTLWVPFISSTFQDSLAHICPTVQSVWRTDITVSVSRPCWVQSKNHFRGALGADE